MSPKITKRYRCYRERGMIAFRTPYCDSSFSFYRRESLILIIIRYEKIQVSKDTVFVIILIWKTPSIFKLYSVNNVVMCCCLLLCTVTTEDHGWDFQNIFFLCLMLSDEGYFTCIGAAYFHINSFRTSFKLVAEVF